MWGTFKLKMMFLNAVLPTIFMVIIAYYFQLVVKVSMGGIIFGVSVGISIYFFLNTKFTLHASFFDMWEVYGNQKYFVILEKKRALGILFWQLVVTFLLPMTIFFLIAKQFDTPAVNAIISVSGMAILSYAIVKNRKVLKASYGNISSFLKNISDYLYILKILKFEKIREKKDLIYMKINSYKLVDNSYRLSRFLNIGDDVTTYFSILALNYLQLKSISKKSAEWFLNLENKKGGFSPLLGLKPRLSSTYRALSILNMFNMIQSLDITVHSTWAKSLQKEEGFFSDSISKFPKIEQTFYALNSLYVLGKFDEIKKRQCIDWIRKTWRDESKNLQLVFHSIKCLELLGELDEKLKEEVKNVWVFPQVSGFKNFKVDRNLKDFYYFFKVAEIVMDNDEEIKNLIPGIEGKVYDSFIYYLENK